MGVAHGRGPARSRALCGVFYASRHDVRGDPRFFGLAVVTMDVLGGVLAIGVMLRSGTVRHLLAFAGGYTVIIIGAR